MGAGRQLLSFRLPFGHSAHPSFHRTGPGWGFGRREAPTRMFNRFATLAAACVMAATAAAPVALADPDPAPPGGPAGPVPSGPPGVLTTPDGWTLTVSGSNESLEPVAPLTGSIASREYLVDGTFTGAITGGGSTKLGGGSLEAGYQIGCGIIADDIESISSAG